MYFYHSTEVHTFGKNQKFCFKQSTDKKMNSNLNRVKQIQTGE